MAGIFLLLGTNLGDRSQNLADAVSSLARKAGPLVRESAVYQTAAWGKTDQPWFLNQAIELATTLDPFRLLSTILDLEMQLGRERIEKWGERRIDIDILLYNNQLIHTRDLIVPHPQLEHRRFALTPLAEIAGNVVHPRLGKKISELLADCPDQLAVEKYIV
jgi:2-amino-4-hydroxy-6-hydroxymethyldihydropteridine diphosphokinase